MRRRDPSVSLDIDIDDRISPEQRLFVATIANALRDATGTGTGTPTQRAAALMEARQWFAAGDDDFRYVCENAGFSPLRVQEAALALFERSDNGEPAHNLRAKPGKRGSLAIRTISQSAIASSAGTTQQTVSRVLNGLTSPKSEAARRVHEAIGVLTKREPRLAGI